MLLGDGCVCVRARAQCAHIDCGSVQFCGPFHMSIETPGTRTKRTTTTKNERMYVLHIRCDKDLIFKSGGEHVHSYARMLVIASN